MLEIRLSDETERRLEAPAGRTGRTKTFYAREAIEAHLDDLEDFHLAEERLKDFRSEDAIPLADLIDSLRRLWAQGEASGASVEGNFDAGEIAGRGAERLDEARRDD